MTRLFSCLLVALVWSVSVSAQSVHDFSVLQPDSQGGYPFFGSALAAYQNLLFVGAPGSQVNGQDWAGEVRVYRWVEDQWAPEQTLIPEDSDTYQQFGVTVATNGSQVFVGAPYSKVDEVSMAGAVYVFEQDADGLWQQVQRLTDPSIETREYFGISVDVDGSLLAIGELSEGNYRRGSVVIFEHDQAAEQWNLQAVIQDPEQHYKNEFAYSVSLSGDRLLVGAPSAELDCGEVGTYSCFYLDFGAAFLFEKSDSDDEMWVQVASLSASSPVLRGGFGARVVLDGEIAAVSQPAVRNGESQGSVYLFGQTPVGDWSELAHTVPATQSENSEFGADLLLSNGRLWVGDTGGDNDDSMGPGSVYEYDLSQIPPDENAIFTTVSADEGLQLGYSLAVASNRLISGAPGATSSIGAAYSFHLEQPSAVAETLFEPTTELSNDDLAAGPSGIYLGLPEGSQLDPLPVWIVEQPDPAELPFEDAQPVGTMINVGASAWLPAPEGGDIVLTIPVPDGAEPSRLFAARLMQPQEFLSLHPVPGPVWVPALSFLDEENSELVVPLKNLQPFGTDIALFTVPEDHPFSGEALVPFLPDVETSSFDVRCFQTSTFDNLTCSDEDEELVAYELQAAWDRYQMDGFREPNLFQSRYRRSGERIVPGEQLRRWQILLWSAESYMCSGRGESGNAAPGIINLCLGYPVDLDLLDRTIVHHELFHTIQYSYESIVALPFRDRWVTEGMASIASQAPALARDLSFQRHVRTIRVSLDSTETLPGIVSGHEVVYSAQDFWMWLGLHLDLPYTYFHQAMANGLGSSSVDSALGQFGTSLPQAYWNWVKNQTIEKSHDLGGALKIGPCIPESQVIGMGMKEMTFSGGLETQADFLQPLSARVHKILFELDEDYEDLSVEVVSSSGAIQHKSFLEHLYIEPSGDPPRRRAGDEWIREYDEDCHLMPDGPRIFPLIEKDEFLNSYFIYVLVANTNYAGGSIAYELRVGAG